MKTIIALSLLAVSSILSAEPTKEEIMQTVEHIQRIAKDSEQRADTLAGENALLAGELAQTKSALDSATAETADAQAKVDKVTAWGNSQASRADKAETDRDYWHAKQKEAVGKLWWWRLWAGGCIAIGVLLIIGGFVMKFTAWGAKNLAPLVTKSLI